ncbi:MAG: SNF2-related protein, partial [Nocardioides sp.]
EAVALSLDQVGGVDLELIARLLGLEVDEARAQLGTLVFDDPATDRLVHAPEYLSGDVRTKLDQARAAAADDDRYAVNIEALVEVVPESIGIDQIEARLGSVWITAAVHQQFLTELLDDSSVRVENPMPGAWEVRGLGSSLLASNQWGTERRPAPMLAKTVMEQRRVEVYDEYDDGVRVRRVLNAVETTAAQEKAEALQERFSAWVWEDPARAVELAEVYNRRFNSIRLRDYNTTGDYLTLPGLAASIELRAHQRAAVARMIAEPAVGLFHQVGAGKTLEMVVGATELRRMGLVSKPAVVVPNHMLEQFSREWIQAYPQARILAASTTDLAGDKRRLFVARAAANDWDAVIMTQGAFKKIGLSPEFGAAYIDAQLNELRTALTAARADGASMSVKRIEKRILTVGERYKKALDLPRDPGISFQNTGIDYLIVDEAHMYKNLATESNISDAAIAGSQQATDLHMKLEYLRGRHGGRVATMATATPLANSITEAYIMQRYLRPDLLAAAGITSFDGWAATFGSQVTGIEMGPAGGFRLKTRFAKFQNVPEMLRMWRVFADVKTGADLNLPVPQLAPRPGDGVRDVETVVLPPTPELEAYIARIADRAELVANRAVDPAEDNMLLISTDGRKAALDLRLVDPGAVPSGLVKLDAVAERILEHWHRTRTNTYLDEATGQPSPVPGGLQLVFSDLGTPHETRWDAYTELKTLLVAGGMPSDAVRFIHEATNDAGKARLFAAARAGHVAVLVGSTAKMGVGTNVQNRLTALHHIDCPWRPADLEQRDGRGIRQGNQNREVAITRYVVERSFDAYSWQTVARKAAFIAQIMTGRLDAREIEDIGDTALSAAEAKALASGNPLILEKATADQALQKLRRQETAHHRAQSTLRLTQHTTQQTIDQSTHALELLHAAQRRTTDTAGENFHITIDGRRYRTRPDAAAALTAWAKVHDYAIRSTGRRDQPLIVGEIGGHQLTAYGDQHFDLTHGTTPTVVFGLAEVPGSHAPIKLADLTTKPNLGAIRTLENKPAAIGRRITQLEAELHDAHRTLADVQPRLGQPFPHAADLKAAARRVEEIDHALNELSKPGPDHSDPSPAAVADPDLTEQSAEPRRIGGAAVERRTPPTGPAGSNRAIGLPPR